MPVRRETSAQSSKGAIPAFERIKSRTEQTLAFFARGGRGTVEFWSERALVGCSFSGRLTRWLPGRLIFERTPSRFDPR
jgi:hypothetical protein